MSEEKKVKYIHNPTTGMVKAYFEGSENDPSSPVGQGRSALEATNNLKIEIEAKQKLEQRESSLDPLFIMAKIIATADITEYQKTPIYHILKQRQEASRFYVQGEIKKEEYKELMLSLNSDLLKTFYILFL